MCDCSLAHIHESLTQAAAMGELAGVLLFHIMRMGMTADVVISLEQVHVVLARQQPCRCQTGDFLSDTAMCMGSSLQRSSRRGIRWFGPVPRGNEGRSRTGHRNVPVSVFLTDSAKLAGRMQACARDFVVSLRGPADFSLRAGRAAHGKTLGKLTHFAERHHVLKIRYYRAAGLFQSYRKGLSGFDGQRRVERHNQFRRIRRNVK
jgi:hypothetical protein